MDLPTYTNIWRIEKRLYKLYDFRLPAPLPINWIAVFAGITIPYIVFLVAIGLPFNHTLVWLYVLPPGVLTWLTTRPVIENKRLPELLESQVRYLTEPRVWVRLAPLNEKDQIVVTAKVWHSRRAPQRREAGAGTVALRGRGTLARRNRAAVQAPVEESALARPVPASASAAVVSARSRSRSGAKGSGPRVRVRGTGPQAPVPGTANGQRSSGKQPRPAQRNRAPQRAQSPQRARAAQQPPVQQPPARRPRAPRAEQAQFGEQAPLVQQTSPDQRAPGAKPGKFRLAALRSRPAGPAPALPPGVALKPTAGPGQPHPAGRGSDAHFGDPSGMWPGQPQPPVPGNGQPRQPGHPSARHAGFAQPGPVRPAPAQGGPVWPTQALHTAQGGPSLGSAVAPVPSDMPAHATPDVYPAMPAPGSPAALTKAAAAAPEAPARDTTTPAPETPRDTGAAPPEPPARDTNAAAPEPAAGDTSAPAPETAARDASAAPEAAASDASAPAPEVAARDASATTGTAAPTSVPARVRGNGALPIEVAHTGRRPRPLPPTAVPPGNQEQPWRAPARPVWPAQPTAHPAAAAGRVVPPDAADARPLPAPASPAVTPPAQDAEAPRHEGDVNSPGAPDTASPSAARPADLSPDPAAIATETEDKAQTSSAPEADEAPVTGVVPPAEAQPPAEVRVTAVQPQAAAPDAQVQPQAAEPDAPAAPTPAVPEVAPQNGQLPVVKAVADTEGRAVPSIERALSGPSKDRNLTWHGKVRIVTGMGATQGPGARDQEALDRTRARLPLRQPKRILVLGCTSGAGQTVTTMMTGHILASLREHPVAAVDLHDGTLARYSAPAAWLDEILRGKAPQQPTPVRANGLHPKPKPNPARLDVIASHDPLRDGDEIKLAVQLSRHYPLAMLDPGAAGLMKLLKVTDQLVVVVPASVEAAGALADTREWLDAHGFAELASNSVTLINGVSRRSMIDVENAESVARGRCRAIVRVPWDDMLPVAVAGPSTLRPQTRVAYTALAGVLVAGLAAAPVRTKQ